LEPLVDVIWYQVWINNRQRNFLRIVVIAQVVWKNDKLVILLYHCSNKLHQTIKQSFKHIWWVGRQGNAEVGSKHMGLMFGAEIFLHERVA